MKLTKPPRYKRAETALVAVRNACVENAHPPDLDHHDSATPPAALFCRCGDITWYPSKRGDAA